MLNRSIAIVRVKAPFKEWLRSLPDSEDTTLQEINSDNSTYLLPTYELGYEQEEILRHFFEAIFEDQLNDWWTAEKDWPRKRTFETFRKWFDVELHSCVVDLVDEPLEDDKRT